MDVNAIATNLIVVFVIILLIWGLFAAMSPERWRCPECGQEFYGKETAQGHQAVHAMHKPTKVD